MHCRWSLISIVFVLFAGATLAMPTSHTPPHSPSPPPGQSKKARTGSTPPPPKVHAPVRRDASHGDTHHPLKLKSEEYRAHAEKNPRQIRKGADGQWTSALHPHGTVHPATQGSHWQADHMLEGQTVTKALEHQNLQWHELHPDHQKKLQSMLNHHSNMQPVPARKKTGGAGLVGVNQDKEHLVANGLNGKAPPEITEAATRHRNAYSKEAMHPAAHTAARMDRYLNKIGAQGNVLDTHLNSMIHAGILVKDSDEHKKLQRINQDYAVHKQGYRDAKAAGTEEAYLAKMEADGHGHFVDHIARKSRG